MKIRILLAILLICTLVACGSASDSPAEAVIENPADKNLSFELVERGTSDGFIQESGAHLRDVSLLTFYDQGSFNGFWASLKAGESPMPEAPQFDFANKTVLVVLCPVYSSGGHSLQIDEVYESDNEVFVIATQTSPGQDCIVPTVMTQPFEIIEIDSTDAPISLQLTDLTEDCIQ